MNPHLQPRPMTRPVKPFSVKIKEWLWTPYMVLAEVDDYIQTLDNSITSSMDMILDEIQVHNCIKNVFKGKQIQFIFLILINFYLIFNDFSSELPFMFIKMFYYSNLLVMVCTVFLVYSTEPGVLRKIPDFEEYIIKQQPLIKNNVCGECKVLKCLRSSHCHFCQQ